MGTLLETAQAMLKHWTFHGTEMKPHWGIPEGCFHRDWEQAVRDFRDAVTKAEEAAAVLAAPTEPQADHRNYTSAFEQDRIEKTRLLDKIRAAMKLDDDDDLLHEVHENMDRRRNIDRMHQMFSEAGIADGKSYERLATLISTRDELVRALNERPVETWKTRA